MSSIEASLEFFFVILFGFSHSLLAKAYLNQPTFFSLQNLCKLQWRTKLFRIWTMICLNLENNFLNVSDSSLNSSNYKKISAINLILISALFFLEKISFQYIVCEFIDRFR